MTHQKCKLKVTTRIGRIGEAVLMAVHGQQLPMDEGVYPFPAFNLCKASRAKSAASLPETKRRPGGLLEGNGMFVTSDLCFERMLVMLSARRGHPEDDLSF